MRIYINGRFLSQRITGVQRYAREMVIALDELLQESPTDDEWCILAPKNMINDLSIVKIKIKQCGICTGHLWEQLELPVYSKNGVLLNFCNCAPLIKKKQLVVIHDAAVARFPKAYSWKFRLWYKLIFYICGIRADKIVTVSNFSRNELNKYFNIKKEKISVIYNGLEHMDRIEACDSIIDDFGLIDKHFVLGVGSRNPTKNFALVLQAARLLPNIKFVIAGGINDSIFAKKHTEKLRNVIYTGYVSDEILVALYRHAMVFVYPSLYEGFGIPPLEAITQGCPVIVSDCASLPEICGNHVRYCASDDAEGLADLMMEIISGSKWQLDIETIKRKYSWKKSAKELIHYINQ